MADGQPSFGFDNSYVKLPERFYARQAPTPMPAPRFIQLNRPLIQELGLQPGPFESEQAAAYLAGTVIPAGAEPISMVYGGHQFGGWAGRLGDGRAVLMGELLDRDQGRWDLHLKGAGRTPFSRAGDGRAVLGPVLREYIVSEAMHALRVPTSRALAALYTGETVLREAPLPGAILVRVARSHVRVGTFEYFLAAGDDEALRLLADYVIARHYPQFDDEPDRFESLLRSTVTAQAKLVAAWMHVGFIHGVMNTDNTQLAGETIDYGPCAFMDNYHPGTVFSSIDHMGRYAYANQPRVAHWNLACLARCLLPLLDQQSARAVEIAQAVVDEFPLQYEREWLAGMRAKIGLMEEMIGDQELIERFLSCLQGSSVDFTMAFRALSSLDSGQSSDDSPLCELFESAEEIRRWLVDWRARLIREHSVDEDRQAAMKGVNPAFIPRNHLVEAAIQAALKEDLEPLEDLLKVSGDPFSAHPGFEHMLMPPKPHEVVPRTFCGT